MTQEQRLIALAQAIGLDIKSLNTTISQLVGNSMVATRINRNTNQAIPTGTGWTDLVWNVSNYESNGDFWSSGATVTIPENGLYFITAEASFDGTGLIAIATINMQIEVVVSGTPIVIGDDEKQLQVNTKGSLFVFAQRYFSAGDTIKTQVKHSDAGSLTVLTQGTHSPDIIVTKLNGAKGEQGDAGGALPIPITITVPSPIKNFGVFEHSQTISVPGILATDIIQVFLAPHLDTDENNEDSLDIVSLSAKSGNNTITITVVFSSLTSGPIKLYYKKN